MPSTRPNAISQGTTGTIASGVATVPFSTTWTRYGVAAAIPGARSVTLRGCGHVPTWDDPEQVARVLLEGSAGSRLGATQRG